MKKQFLEAGKIVNTHGVRGEVKIQPWTSSADFLKGFKTLYIDNEPKKVNACRIHKGNVIIAFDGVLDIDAANALRGKTVFINRDDAKLAKGEYFLQDVIGLPAVNDETGEELGIVQEILNLPASDVYVIKGKNEILVPAVPEFIKSVDTEAGYVRIKIIEGM